MLAAAIITGLRLARDPRVGSKTERVVNAVDDGIFLANQISCGWQNSTAPAFSAAIHICSSGERCVA